MLSNVRRRFAVLLMQVLAAFLGLLSAAVLLTGFFVVAVLALALAFLVLAYVALFHRRRRWQY